jgi:hypothetical protein
MRSLYLTGASMLLVACTVDAPTNVGTTTQLVEAHNRLASNRLASNRLASNRLASNRLASNRLASNRLASNSLTAQILESEAGRDVYSYIVSCALPEGMTIEATIEGSDPVEDTAPPETSYTCDSVTRHCVFPGAIGLAEDWIDKPLDRRGQGWVSACLFARVNANHTAESISMRGRHAGLVVSASEAELYTAEEGAFYGNLFVDDPDPAVEPDWHACRGEAKAACSGDVGCGGLANRDCATEDPANPGYTLCGFQYAGDCADFTPDTPSPYACASYNADAGYYGNCRAEPGDGAWPQQHKYRQVITTWVANN